MQLSEENIVLLTLLFIIKLVVLSRLNSTNKTSNQLVKNYTI